MPEQLKQLAIEQLAIERARHGQLRTKSDAERLRTHHRILQERPLPSQPSATRTGTGSVLTAPGSPQPGIAVQGETIPVSSSNGVQQEASSVTPQGSPENPVLKSNKTKETSVRKEESRVLVAGEMLGGDARALRLAESMAAAVDAFVEYMKERPGLPEDDPAIVLAQRARKSLAYFEAMRHVSG